MAWGARPVAALAIGAGLALSSTTIVLRLLTDRGQLTTRCGRGVFAVLMVQDLLVGPLLVAILAMGEGRDDLWLVLCLAFLKALVAVVAIFVLGRRLLGPLYRPIAAAASPELFTGLSVLVVVGLGYLTHAAGLSLAFGGFLAGVLLADSAYRHQIAADIRPFRGLLLGLFFVAVGMQLDLAVFLEHPFTLIAGVLALFVLKAAIVAPLAMAAGLDRINALRTALMLAQGGEFAFVLWTAAGHIGAVPEPVIRVLIVAVALSMAATPLVFMALDRVLQPPAARPEPVENDPEEAAATSDHVVVVGCGLVGAQVIERLEEAGLTVAALDRDPDKVRALRRRGVHAYFGDATQPDVLEMIGVDRATAVVVALDEAPQTLLVVGVLRYIFPDMPVLCRAHDEAHGQRLSQAGATIVVPEVIDTGRHLAEAMLIGRPIRPAAG